MSNLQIKIIAKAVVIRVQRGEGTVLEIVDNYNLSEEDKGLVLEQIVILYPDVTIS